MIALNEIISNKEKFEEKYNSMGKKIKLNKIIKLEEDFIAYDKKACELRALCNKLCSEIAELINTNSETTEAISKINKIDKEILFYEKKSSKAMNKINKKLNKLPNIPIEKNTLNIAVKTKKTSFSKKEFIDKINNISQIESINQNEKIYLESLKKIVFKAENLPKVIKAKGNHKQKYIILCGSDALSILNDLQNSLTENAKYLTIKSIKSLKKESSKELYATLTDNSFISVKFLGEFLSREKLIKLYDKKLDMTKFVNIIKISIK